MPGNALSDLDYPALVLHEAALRHNIATMQDYCSTAGVRLAPHAKTSMSYEICHRQLAAGAWGLTAATPAQVRTLHGLGAKRILMANVLVDRSAISWVGRELLADPTMEFLCYVDSLDGVRRLDETLTATAPDGRLNVLVEIGYVGGRTGVRSTGEVRAVARAVQASTRLALRGVAGYEGLLPRVNGGVPTGLIPFLADIREATHLLWEAKLLSDDAPPIVTAGGSSYFDFVVDRLGPQAFDFPVQTVLRSGCYVTHDHGVYRHVSPLDGRAPANQPRLRPALELLASVWSRPERELAIAGLGRRDAPTDDQLPVILGRYGADGYREPVGDCDVVAVDDQHAYVRVPADSTLRPGDLLSVGLSHPCGAFDRRRVIPLVNGGYDIVGTVSTAF